MEKKSGGGCFKTLVALCVLVALTTVLFFLTKDTVSGWLEKTANTAMEALASKVQPSRTAEADPALVDVFIQLAKEVSASASGAAASPPGAESRHLILFISGNYSRAEIFNPDGVSEAEKFFFPAPEWLGKQDFSRVQLISAKSGETVWNNAYGSVAYALDSQATDEKIAGLLEDEEYRMTLPWGAAVEALIVEKNNMRSVMPRRAGEQGERRVYGRDEDGNPRAVDSPLVEKEAAE